MLSALAARGARIADAACARAVERLAADFDAVPGVAAEPVDGGVALRGPGLARRWLADARLRWAGRVR